MVEEILDYDTWMELLLDAEEKFSSDGVSPAAIIDFLSEMLKWDELPKEAKLQDITKFSFIMQECIIQRICSVNNEGIRNHMHHLSTYTLVKFLTSFKLVNQFKVQSETIKQLNLAMYIKKAELTPAHSSLIVMAVKMFLQKVAIVSPTEIMSDTKVLLKIMRDDYVAQNEVIETLETRIQKLEDANARVNGEMQAEKGMRSKALENAKIDLSETFHASIAKLNEFYQKEGATNKTVIANVGKRIDTTVAQINKLHNSMAMLDQMLKSDFTRIDQKFTEVNSMSQKVAQHAMKTALGKDLGRGNSSGGGGGGAASTNANSVGGLKRQSIMTTSVENFPGRERSMSPLLPQIQQPHRTLAHNHDTFSSHNVSSHNSRNQTVPIHDTYPSHQIRNQTVPAHDFIYPSHQVRNQNFVSAHPYQSFEGVHPQEQLQRTAPHPMHSQQYGGGIQTYIQ